MTYLYIYFLLAAMALEFLFALWANHRAQSVLDTFIAHPSFTKRQGGRLIPICAQARHCHAALGDWARRVDYGAAGVGFVFHTF
ncbi:MAG: hypothetical protein ACFNNL_02310 [Kingella oralis]|jgi:hypothetical protein